MGLPTPSIPDPSNPSAAAAISSPTVSGDASAPPTAASQLPPEALDLASKLFDLARAGSDDLLTYLSAGIPPNLTNATGDTLLMLASYHGHTTLVAGLLDRGADPDVCNDRGQSPIAGAVFKGYEGVVDALVKGGADKNAGRPTAGECALMFRRTGCARLLGVELPEDQRGEAPQAPVG